MNSSHNTTDTQQSHTDKQLSSPEAKLVTQHISSRELGILGEQYVSSWLENMGWRILDRNWRTRFGELDIVALDHRERLTFVEVKTRRNRSYGRPEEAVTYKKRIRLKHAASQWLSSHEKYTYAHAQGMRFDVAAVSIYRVKGITPKISVKYIQGAF